MMKSVTSVTLVLLLIALAAPAAMAQDLAADYLLGRWAIDAQDCSSSDAEYMVFQTNGTFEISRRGITEVVGFWDLKGDYLNLHMVTSPAHFQDIHEQLKRFEGVYSYFHSKVILINAQKNGFQAAGVIGNELKKATAVKCQ
jgi:hypothetical protein